MLCKITPTIKPTVAKRDRKPHALPSAVPPTINPRVSASIPAPTMAWRCHGHSNQSLVKALKEAGLIQSKPVEMAMLSVDRGLFLPKSESRFAFNDAPHPIGCGQTISAPHMHAHCLELLATHLKPGNRVLDVGSGSGYLAAVMARMVCPPGSEQGAQGLVVGVEHFPELVQHSIASVRAMDWSRQLMDEGHLKLIQTDGRQGYPAGAPFDVIHVGAAAPQVPRALTEQLAPGGRLVMPVGEQGASQELMVIDKTQDGKHFKMYSAMGVVYVPLTDLPSSGQPVRAW